MHVLEVVVELVKMYVHLLIVKLFVLCHVVVIHVPENQAMTVMVLCVIPVVVILVVETVLLVAHVEETVLLMDVIHHVIIGVITCVHKEHHVELLLVRPQAENESKNKQSLTR